MSTYDTETFGILTDDDLYLDCLLVRPPGKLDSDLEILDVWVPRYPLTKNSVVTCARREVTAAGMAGNAAHLAFDLRGTGDSEGGPGNSEFEIDLNGISAWAGERFGPIDINFRGLPQGAGQANLLPVGPGVALEYYFYSSNLPTESPSEVVYMSTYGNFGVADETACQAIASAGYDVYALDPLRFLLHASTANSLEPSQLLQQLQFFCQAVSIQPIVIGQPVSAGLALLWTAMDREVRGAIAIGEAQSAFARGDIFDNRHMYTFFLGRHVHRVAPRAVVYVVPLLHNVQRESAILEELDALYQSSGQPRRIEREREVTASLLVSQLQWIAGHFPDSVQDLDGS